LSEEEELALPGGLKT